MTATIKSHVSVRGTACAPTVGGRSFVSVLVTGAILATSVVAQAQGLYPACNSPDQTQCAMEDTGNSDMMTGDGQFPGGNEGNWVAVYAIFYGPWTGSANQSFVATLPNFIASLNDSSYEAITETYQGNSGTAPGRMKYVVGYTDSSYSEGKSLTDATIQAEVSLVLTNGDLPKDPNAIYMVLPDNTVSLQNYCTVYCGYNETAMINGSNLHYIVVGDPINNCSGC